MEVHRKLPQLVDVDGLQVLSLRLTNEPSLCRREHHVEFRCAVFVRRGFETEQPQRCR